MVLACADRVPDFEPRVPERVEHLLYGITRRTGVRTNDHKEVEVRERSNRLEPYAPRAMSPQRIFEEAKAASASAETASSVRSESARVRSCRARRALMSSVRRARTPRTALYPSS